MSLTSVKACIGRKIAALTLVCAVAVTSLPVTAYAAVSPSDINANAVSDSDAVQPKENSSIPDKNADCPIIIVPGIMGSRLYQADERGRDDLVWAEGDMTKLSTYLWVLDALSLLPGKDTTLGEEIDISNELYVLHNSDKQNELPKYKREYGATDAYENMVDTLCDEFGEERDIYFFSYDWRQSNVDSAQKLSEQIKNVLKGTEFDKVDLVCHSMGGGVASYYVSRYGESRIRKIITCGTPYEGAAAIFNRTLTNRILEIPVGDVLMSIAGLNTRRKVELPSISELLPSEAYFNADGTFCKGDKILGVFGLNKNSVEKINYEQYSEICRDIYGKNFDISKSVYNSSNSGGFNVLANLDNSYFIIGTQQQTVNSVTFTSGLD
ncbi:MAG: alpha/beta fold hydrolase, partial [Firmicutes bacterium]|nr:alpha/beta fold hydrolase [Bacillota bacterium]